MNIANPVCCTLEDQFDPSNMAAAYLLGGHFDSAIAAEHGTAITASQSHTHTHTEELSVFERFQGNRVRLIIA